MKDDPLERELRFHIDQLAAKYVAQGMSEDEARCKARQEFGGIEQLKEECRDVRPTLCMESTLQDVRFALRMMRRRWHWHWWQSRRAISPRCAARAATHSNRYAASSLFRESPAARSEPA